MIRQHLVDTNQLDITPYAVLFGKLVMDGTLRAGGIPILPGQISIGLFADHMEKEASFPKGIWVDPTSYCRPAVTTALTGSAAAAVYCKILGLKTFDLRKWNQREISCRLSFQ